MPKAQATNGKKINWTSSKLKNLVPKGTIKKVKSQPKEQGKILTDYILNKSYIQSIYRTLTTQQKDKQLDF